MPVTSPKPYNVKYPQGNHIARVVCGQDVRVVLHSPEVCGFSKGYKWDFDLQSHYLSFDKTIIEDRDKDSLTIFVFKQTTFPLAWQSLSTLFLGNIHVRMRHPENSMGRGTPVFYDHHSSVHVYLECSEGGRKDIITVVDPIHDQIAKQCITLEPSQTMEVVVGDEPHNPLEWQSLILPDCKSSKLLLNRIYQERLSRRNVLNRGTYSKDHQFYIERRIFPGNQYSACPYFDEHHFFFTFSDLPDLSKWENGMHPASRLVILGKSDGGYCKDQRLSVHISLRNKSKAATALSPHTQSPNLNKLCHKRRELHETARCLTNPDVTDRVYLRGAGDIFTIDIAQPAVLYGITNELEAASWNAEIRSVTKRDKYSKCIKVECRGTRWLGKVRYQRYQIRLQNPPTHCNEVMLGKLVLTCDELKGRFSVTERVVFIVLNKENSNHVKKHNVGNSTYNVHSAASNDAASNVIQQSNNHVQKKNNGKSSRKYWKNKTNTLEYYEVSLTDFGSFVDILDGERVDLMSGTRYNHSHHNSFYDPRHYNPDDYFDSGDVPLLSYSQTEKKKRNTNGTTKLLEESAASNGSLNENARSSYWGRQKNYSPLRKEKAEKVLKEEKERNKNMLIPDVKPPQKLIWPKARQDVMLRQGEPLVLVLPMLHGNLPDSSIHKVWTANPINMLHHKGHQVWIHSNDVKQGDEGVPFQEIEVRLLVRKGLPLGEGRHKFGAIVLQCGDETRHITLYLDLEDDDPKEPLEYWKSYWRSLKTASHLDLSKQKFCRDTSIVKNRTTLIDPIGETIDIPIQNHHEIEIILNTPTYVHGEWDVQPSMIGGGEFELLDYSTYSLWSNDRVCRSLFRVVRTKNNHFGEIKIRHNGEDVGTRIRVYGDKTSTPTHLLCNAKQPSNRGNVTIVGNASDPQKIRIADWANCQQAIIFPTDHVHIEVPHLRDYLSDNFHIESIKGEWEVGLCEVSLEDDVYEALSSTSKDSVDQLSPYYFNHGVLHPGKIPWDYHEYILPPLEKSQPLIYDILKALRKVKGLRPSYPLIELEFKHEIAKQFFVNQTLYLNVADPHFKTSNDNGLSLYNPPDQSEVQLHDAGVLTVKLPYKEVPVDRCTMRRLQWHIDSLPPWLIRMNYDNNDRQEIFNFFAELPSEHKQGSITGMLKFLCDDGQEKILNLTAFP